MNEPNSQTNQDNPDKNSNQDPSLGLPVESPPDEKKISKPHANTTKTKQYPSKKSSTDRTMAGATVIIALATIAYAGIAFYQLHVMSNTLKEMQGSGKTFTTQTDRLIAEANQIAASMTKAVKQSQVSLEEANRAWIVPRGASIDWQHTSTDWHTSKDRIVAIKVDYENTGKEPALAVTTSYYVGDWVGPAVNKGGQAVFPIIQDNMCKPHTPGGAPIWPRADGSQKDSKILMMTDPKFLKNFNLMLSGIRTLYVKGCFTYVTFGKEHHSAFCYYMKPIEEIGPSGVTTMTEEGRVKVGTKLNLPFVVCPNPNTTYAD